MFRQTMFITSFLLLLFVVFSSCAPLADKQSRTLYNNSYLKKKSIDFSIWGQDDSIFLSLNFYKEKKAFGLVERRMAQFKRPFKYYSGLYEKKNDTLYFHYNLNYKPVYLKDFVLVDTSKMQIIVPAIGKRNEILLNELHMNFDTISSAKTQFNF